MILLWMSMRQDIDLAISDTRSIHYFLLILGKTQGTDLFDASYIASPAFG
jgi:hypothetical protein